jgi:PAS domain S-box-containing protein
VFWALATDLFGVVAEDGRLAAVNPAWERTLGWAEHELTGTPLRDLLHPDDVEHSVRALAQGQGSGLENRLRCKDGTFRFFVWSGYTEGRTWCAVGRDVTSSRIAAAEHEAQRERLRLSESRLREAQRLAGLFSWEWDAQRDVLITSEAFSALWGFAGPEIPMREAIARMPRAVGRRVEDAIAALRAGEEGFALEYAMTDRTGRLAHLSARGRAIRDRCGALIGVWGVTQDVTDAHRASDEIRTQARLLDAVGVSVIALDLDGRVTHWNAGAERLYGWTPDEALGRPARDLLVMQDDGESAEEIRETMMRTGSWEGRFPVLRRDGSVVEVDVRNALLRDPAGRPEGFVGVSVDAADRMRAERELRAARDYLHAVTESMGEGVCTLDLEGRVVYMNAAAQRMLGWREEELIGKVLHDVSHNVRADGTALPIEECPILRARRDGTVVRVDDDVFLRRDGSSLPVEYTAAPFETSQGLRGSVLVFSDIAERKAQEQAMRRELEALGWVRRIRAALDEDRFVLHAQPIVDMTTGETVQHELLIRMLGEDGAVIPPGAFLPVAEEHGLIGEIDRWVIRRAIALAGQGHAVELNISAQSLGDPGLAAVVARELEVAGADPGLLVFELTETSLLSDEKAGRRSSRPSGRSDAGSRSTTSAPATAASPTSSASPWSTSRSTSSSSATSSATRRAGTSSAPSSASPAASGCRPSPRASRTARRWRCCASWASTSPRATCSAAPPRPPRSWGPRRTRRERRAAAARTCCGAARRASRPRRPLSAVVALGAAAVVVTLAAYAVPSSAALATADAGWTLAALAAVAGLHRAERTTRGDATHGSWRLLLIGAVAWLAGQLVWNAIGLAGGTPQVPTVADALWLAFAGIAIVALARQAPAPGVRGITAIDVAIITIATGAVAAAAFGPEAADSALSALGAATALAYAALYVALMATAVHVFVRRRTVRQPAHLALILGTVLEAAAFVLWAPMLLAGDYAAGASAIDLLFTLGLVAIAAAGLAARPSAEGAALPATDLRDGIIVPAAAALTLVLAVGAASIRGEPLEVRLALQGALLGVGFLLFARMWLTGGEQVRLMHREREATEHARFARSQLDRFFATAPEMLCVADATGRFVRVNPHASRLLGWTADELTARPFTDFVHPDDRGATDAEMAQLVDGRPSVSLENRYRHRDGHYVTLAWQASPGPDGLIYATAHDITVRCRVEDELQRSNAELEQFAYIASHDLSEPLRTIAGFAELLDKRYPDLDDRARRYIRHITEGADRQRRLIDSLLAYSRAGRDTLELRDVDTGQVVADVLDDLRSAINLGGGTIDVDPLPAVHSDPDRLAIVVQNLVANAVKFHRPGAPPRVHISGSCDRDRVLLSIRDDGIGIDPIYAEKVFGPFERLNGRDTFPGTGIGLAIARRLAERLGGTLTVQPAEGGGSDFRLTLPGAMA